MIARRSPLWLLLFALYVGTALLFAARLAGAPRLPIAISPDLRVRSVRAGAPQAPNVSLARGDRFVSLFGARVDDLIGARELLMRVGSEAAPVPYQIERPVHRFNLALSKTEPGPDPEALPAGVELGDRLVELDGRAMRPAVGVEGLRSIVSSRPEALLVLERRGALFAGELALEREAWPIPLLIASALALLAALALWRLAHDSLSRLTPLAAAAETLALLWCAPLVFAFQWVIGDPILGLGACAALLLARPLGLLAREASAGGTLRRALWVFGAAAIAIAIVIAGFASGRLADLEVALQFASVFAALFVLFEIAMTGFDEGSGMMLGERSIFLGGLIACVLIACAVAWALDPVAFSQVRWRWFVVLALGLVWVGDLLLCLRGLPRSPFHAIARPEQRRALIRSDLARASEAVEATEARLAIVWPDRALTLGAADDEFALAPAPLADALCMLVVEGAQVRAGRADPRDPVSGVAEALGIAYASALGSDGALSVPGTAAVLYGARDAGAPANAPPSADPLQDALNQLSEGFLAAALLEGLSSAPLAEPPRARPAPEPSAPPAPSAIELASIAHLYTPLAPVPAHFAELIPLKTLATIEELLKTEGPIAIRGPRGAGKSLTASAARLLDALYPGLASRYDAGLDDADRQRAHLEGEPGEPGLISLCEGGALVVERAERLDPGVREALIEARGVRVYLLYEAGADRSGAPHPALAERLVELAAWGELDEARRASIALFALDHAAIERDVETPELSEEELARVMNATYAENIDDLERWARERVREASAL